MGAKPVRIENIIAASAHETYEYHIRELTDCYTRIEESPAQRELL